MLVKKNFTMAVHITLLAILTWWILILPRTSFALPVLPTLNTEFEYLKTQINSTKSNIQKYQTLRRYLNKHHIATQFLDEIEAEMKESGDNGYALQMKILNGIAVISTWGQYNRLGFVLMINADNKVILNDSYDKGIVDVKAVHNPQASPQSLFIIAISSITGTGTYGKLLCVYAIDEGTVYNGALSKPNYEHNSGWGAFEADTVIFSQHNDYQVKNGVYEIHTTGTVSLEYANGNTVQRLLPDEHYVWNPIKKQFLQTEGRITANKVYLTELYGDFADPKGNWFKKTDTTNGQKLRTILSSPEAFVEEKFDHPQVPY